MAGLPEKDGILDGARSMASLRELTYVAPSPIHGRGLFARARIERGAFIGTFRGPRAVRDGRYVLWVFDGETVVGRRGDNRLRFLNHSDRPNAVFDGFDLYARRAIRPGEEITIDYDPL